jgi:hypothetical protein
LFGTTWVVNSIVIAVLLLLIVLANSLIKGKKDLAAWVPYTGIFVTMAISYFAPLHWFFFDSIWMKGITATAVLCSPAFFASIIFIQSFERASFSSEALGSNLFGGLMGGLLESLSLWTGIRALLILGALLYAASAVFLRDRDEKSSVFEETARAAREAEA